MRHGSTLAWWICALSLLGGSAARAGEGKGARDPLDTRLGMRTAPLLLLGRADVQADLALTPIQVASVQRAITQIHARAEGLRGKPNTPAVISARQAIDEAQRRWLSTELTALQQARLIQIDLQWEGPAALATRPSLAEALALTPDQIRQLRAVVTEHRQADHPEPERRLTERVLAVLKPEQRDRWKALLGRPFVVGGSTAAAPANATKR